MSLTRLVEQPLASARSWRNVACSSLLALAACGGGSSSKHVEDAGPAFDAGASPDAGDGGDGKHDKPDKVGPLEITTKPKDQHIDLFGVAGHRFWFDVDDEQLARMNEHGGPGDVGGGIYTPDTSGAHADHLAVQDAKTGRTADYGKVEVSLVGQSTFQPWTKTSIPNLHVDMDEFEKGQTLGGVEHFRLNNGQVGSIFREALAHRVYRELGYPALRATHAFLGGGAWGKKTWVPMTLIEVYKLPFCEANKQLLGGTCTNIWEFPGDAGNDGGWVPGPIDFPVPEKKMIPPGEPPPGGGNLSWLPADACQIKTCDNTRLDDLTEALTKAPDGKGFRAALDDILDWRRFHQFQCLGWMLWTGDDALHNSNNNLVIERDDGKLVWAPYSVDISAGQDWYQYTSLLGQSTIAKRCQRDAECWADTIHECELLIEKFDALDPEKLVDELVSRLEKLDMLRPGDTERAAQIRAWYVTRQETLRDELERYRYLPGPDGCADGLMLCPDNETCGTEQQCEERKCGNSQRWCDTVARCVGPNEPCPTCEGATPLFCPPVSACVASLEACSNECVKQQGQGYVYCPVTSWCALPPDCPGDKPEPTPDGGVPWSTDAGIIPGAGAQVP